MSQQAFRPGSRPFVWLSDLVALKPRIPIESAVRAELRSDPLYSKADLSIKRIRGVWNSVFAEPRGLYEPQLYKYAGFDPLSHYKTWTSNSIADVLTQLRPAEKSVPGFKSTLSRLSHRILRHIVDPRSYVMPDDVAKFLGVLRLNGIRWGVIANSGPHLQLCLSAAVSKSLLDSRHASTASSLVCNAIDDGWAKPSVEIFRRALDMSHSTRGPFDDIYFIGSSLAVDNNVSVLNSLGIRAVLLTDSLPTAESDIELLSADQARLQLAFRIKSLNEMYKLVLPCEEAQYFQSLPSVAVHEALVRKDLFRDILKPGAEPQALSQSPKMRPHQPEKGQQTSKPHTAPMKTLQPLIKDQRERAASDSAPSRRPVLTFDPDERLRPLR